MISLLPFALFPVALLFPQESIPVLIEKEPSHLALVDMEGDHCCSLLEVHSGYLRLPQLTGPALEIEFIGESVLWTVCDMDLDGNDELFALVDGQRLDRLVLQETEPPALAWEPVLDGLSPYNRVPRGLRPASFIQDLDGDGAVDLVIPVSEKVQLWFGKEEGGFRKGPLIRVASSLHLRTAGLANKGLLHRVGRSMTIPALEMNDISGDQIPDLLVADNDLVQQYISGPKGLPEKPTATVDWTKFRDRLPEIRFDPGNIASLARYAVLEEWKDLNADGALDLVVLAGGTVIIYMGGEKGLDLRRPKDQLPTRGNVLYAATPFVDADEFPDLVLLRIEDLSLARLFSFAFMEVNLDFDILAYKGRGDGRFHKRPMKESKSIKLRIPSLISLVKGKDSAEEVRRSVFRLADFDGDGWKNDLVKLDPFGVVRAYSNVVTEPDGLDDLAGKMVEEVLKAPNVVELDIETIGRWALGNTSLLASLVHTATPFFEAEYAPGLKIESPQALAVRDFDGDGIDEILILRRASNPSKTSSLMGFIFDPAEAKAQ